jgi:tRNA threonylcarbamoyladenosine modification (KEOPS) complex Cgi121 subunit
MAAKNNGLTLEIKEYNKFLFIIGVKNFKITDYDVFKKELVKKAQNLEVQLVDARKIFNIEHIYFAAFNALKAFKNGKNISNNLAIELLLYISGQSQIKKAIEIFGLKEGKMDVVFICIGERKKDLENFSKILQNKFNIIIDNSLVELPSRKKIKYLKSIFEISDQELYTSRQKKDALENVLTMLIIERMALLYAKIR